MKQLIILQLTLVSCSLLTTNATDHQQCDKLLHQCNQFKAQCSPDTMALKSCCDLINFPSSKATSAVYQIITNCSCQLSSFSTKAIDAYCDMDTTDGGWMVIPRNKRNGVKSFDKKWKDYEEGFGDLAGGKLWYGLKVLSCFTENGQWEMRVNFQFENRTWSHLHYTQFKVGNTSAEYPLTIGGFTGITPGDPFESSNNTKFSTSDEDNDKKAVIVQLKIMVQFMLYILPNFQPPYVYFNSKGYGLLSMEMKIRQCGYSMTPPTLHCVNNINSTYELC